MTDRRESSPEMSFVGARSIAGPEANLSRRTALSLPAEAGSHVDAFWLTSLRPA